ncbi:hypothetical protein GCM10020219_042700 [Nonomuraea dietziae]
MLTAAATSTNTIRANRFSGSEIVNSPTGGVKKKLSSSDPPTAAVMAGHMPPISATPTVMTRKKRISLGNDRSFLNGISAAVSAGTPTTATIHPVSRRGPVSAAR